MNRVKPPVYAVIPAYNNDETLGFLLRDVIEQEYDRVYVIDDHSADYTVGVAESFGRDVSIIQGDENLGPGANRNRIIPELGVFALLHFLDADVRLNSKHSPEVAREIASADNIGFVGGMVRNPDGLQNPYNFGPRTSLWNDGAAAAQYLIWMAGNHSRGLAKTARAISGPYLRQWPDIYSQPQPREVFWASEANMVIPSSVFTEVGGYDPRFRYSEIFDLSIRLGSLGLRRMFDPALDVTHHGVDSAEDKSRGRLQAAHQLREKYGTAQWLIGVRAASALNLSPLSGMA